MLISTRINVGFYRINVPYNGTYEIERFPDGSWLLFRLVQGERHYLNDYATKRDAMLAIKQIVI